MKHLFYIYRNSGRPGTTRRLKESNGVDLATNRFIGAITDSIDRWVAGFHRRREQRAVIAHLSALNDHLLHDIGLHRGDLRDLRQGVVSLDDLFEERSRGSRPQHEPGARLPVEPVPSIPAGVTGPSKINTLANEQPIDSTA